MINYDKLVNWPFPEIEQKLTRRDAILYALGIGFGADPLDRKQLQFVYEKDLLTVPSMATILCYPGFWLSNPATGVNFRRIVNGGTRFTVYRPLPCEGTFVCVPRVIDVYDKGQGKAAIVHVERRIYDKAGGDLVCAVVTRHICRADGGCGGNTRMPEEVGSPPQTAPDLSVETATARNLALIYRLSGDYNPLHIDPDVAQAAGFQEPILHGLGTLGVATHALLKAVCDYDPARLSSVDVRYTSPVIPGDLIRTDIWCRDSALQFRCVVPARNVTVLDNGQAELAD